MNNNYDESNEDGFIFFKLKKKCGFITLGVKSF